MSSVGHLAPDPWKPYEKHQKEQIFVQSIGIIRMSVGPLKVRYGQSYKKEPKKVHLRWLTRQLQLRLAPNAASVTSDALSEQSHDALVVNIRG